MFSQATGFAFEFARCWGLPPRGPVEQRVGLRQSVFANVVLSEEETFPYSLLIGFVGSKS